MNKTDKISIYIINKNYAKFLNEALQSIKIQSYKNLEIVIIDDHSSDKSAEIIKDFKKKNKNVKIILNKKSIGLIKNINRAIKKCTGKYILRLDSDDYLHPKAIELLHSILKKDKNIGLVFPNFFWINNKSKIISKFNYNYEKACSPKNIPAHGACSMISKKILNKIGMYSNKFDRQDGYYIWFKILKNKYKIHHERKHLFYYRKHKDNLSKNLKKIYISRINIINYFLQKKTNFHTDLINHKKKTIKLLNTKIT